MFPDNVSRKHAGHIPDKVALFVAPDGNGKDHRRRRRENDFLLVEQ